MSKTVSVKICGLRTAEDVAVTAASGAAYCGFNFFARSPRSVSLDDARGLALEAPPGLAKVALTVDADDAFLDDLVAKVPLDMLQLHGRETPARVVAVKARYGLPVMKAVGVADASDLVTMEPYLTVADQILVDAKPPKNSVLPGGNGLPFDWRLIAGRRWPIPWMLAGGLTAQNVAQAIAMTGANQVDLASAVESAPGVKDPDLIRAFMQAVHA
ncbi:phosphoribosylanthranilate isomerase [Roseobacter sp. YSTF-M11]|uniref:N-(5'-phosphoribosyl)anthranilate isomerase n=1 Tax=Roseobacter insulae TaxID=2859783 RepID=A0A9X1K2K0_9RHOB|nr:phosphoribosylanthranilate isomerase [Roseobacter insulae]MBW4710324.1 phosphoribosylanthranilate isomerase [Roseobacter insulae]